MSGPTIDVTKRSAIRTLAARIHRVGIAHVISTSGGVPSVDESTLDAGQRGEAAKILQEIDGALLAVEDVASAANAATMVPHYVKPSCSSCHGGGLVRRGGIDDICACVDQRWQADVNHKAFVDGLSGPGRAAGVRVESTRASDAEARVAAAREVLARACADAAAACADLDAAIGTSLAGVANYFAERARLDASRVASKELAEEQERLADSCAKDVERNRVNVEEVALQIGQLIEPLFQARSSRSVDDGRALAHAAIDEVFALASDADRFYGVQKIAEDVARLARVEEAFCEQWIAAIDAENTTLVDEIARLRAGRGRVAGHHQPKIDRAAKRLRRLVYVYGDVLSVPTDATASPQGGPEER